jgi:hypothetical protein
MLVLQALAGKRPANCWYKSLNRIARRIASRQVKKQNWRFSAASLVWHGPCKVSDMLAEWSDERLGKKKMTYANLSQVAASLVAALVASTIFISAAVGPVGQFI